jgi:hypothetical protein
MIPMKKFTALLLALLLSLSLAAPAALCAGEDEPLPPVREEPEEPGDPIRPLNDDEFPDHDSRDF